MSFALSAGVTGLQAFQQMLDVAGNNLANVNTTAYKSSRILFSDLLSETIRKASQPTTYTGGTNPVQMGSGVGVAGISPNMSQGNIVNTGNSLDMAIEGEGYFVLNDGQQDVYTRAGSFAVDQENNLVDPSTGYIVQRTGTVGVSDGFQKDANNMHVPYDVALLAKATSTVTVAGNLSADSSLTTPQTNVLTSNLEWTTNAGTAASSDTLLTGLDQYTAGTLTNATLSVGGLMHDGSTILDYNRLTADTALTVGSVAATGKATLVSLDQYDAGSGTPLTGATITISGKDHDGTSLSDSGMSVIADTTVQDLINHINSVLDAGGTAGAHGVATLVDGKIVVKDVTGGTSQTAITLTFANGGSATGTLALPSSFTQSGPLDVTSSTTVQDLIGHINTVLDGTGTASLQNGKIAVIDNENGYSLSDVNISFDNQATTGAANLNLPTYFENTTVGGDEIKDINITVYDGKGEQHTLSATFVKTNTDNTWDMILTSISGNVSSLNTDDRRIRGIEFNASDGSYMGLDSTIGDKSQFAVSFADNPTQPQTISISMGTVGQLDGLTQFAGNSTAVAREQNGYSAGSLSTVSVNNEGVLIGAFSNGVKKEIGTLKIALFQNTSGLEAIGGNYFIPSANSGEAVETQAQTGGSGTIHGGALEKSNVDVATEFINLIQAQNGYQANARTITVANQILQELATLIR